MNVSFLLIVLLAGALVTYLAGNKWAGKIALLTSLFSLGTGICLWSHYNDHMDISFTQTWLNQPKLFVALSGDGLSLVMALLTVVLLPLIVLSTFGRQFENARSFYALILFMAFAMVGTFLAVDGLLYYIFWELALIPIYFIALIWGDGETESRQRAIVKFFIYTFAGSLFMLAAFAYMYSQTGSFLWNDLIAHAFTAQEQLWIFLGFFAAYAIKIPLIPFHTWQAKAYRYAPAAGTMLLSGIMLKMGIYSIIRWQLPIAPEAASTYQCWWIGLGVAGVIYGSLVALRQTDLKKLLAYSSLAHVGLITAGIYAMNGDGLRGAVMQMLAHGIVVVGLFFAGDIIAQRYGTYEIAEMGGIRSLAPRFASFFLIILMASVGLPGTFSFIGEFLLLFSLSQVHIGWVIAGGLTIILGAYYSLRMFQHVMLGPANARAFAALTTTEIITLTAVAALLLFFGLYPKPLMDLVTPTLEQILTIIQK